MIDSNAVMLAMIASIPPTITAIASLLASLRNHNSITKLHREINGRMGQLLESTKEAAHSAGKIEQSIVEKAVALEVLREVERVKATESAKK